MFREDCNELLFQHHSVICTGREIRKMIHSTLLFLHIGGHMTTVLQRIEKIAVYFCTSIDDIEMHGSLE